MKIALISFTREGAGLCRKLMDFLANEDDSGKGNTQAGNMQREKTNPDGASRKNECRGFVMPKWAGMYDLEAFESSVSIWAGKAFESSDAIIFIGAAGIAVRSIAPYVKDKFKDPAVIVIDSGASFVIPILSGHAGGANALAEKIALFLDAMPVITTGTDVHKLFSVDVFAVKNRLAITNRLRAKKVSADILDGKIIHICCPPSQFPKEAGFNMSQVLTNKLLWSGSSANADVIISAQIPGSDTGNSALLLVPEKSVWIGIGCRKGVSPDAIKEALDNFISKYSFHEKAIAGLASIDLKKEEEGILKVCDYYHLPFRTYSASDLMSIEGKFEKSEFVHLHTGTDNVCERAALMAAARDAARENGQIIWSAHDDARENESVTTSSSANASKAFALSVISKQKYTGITLAAAYVNRRFEL